MHETEKADKWRLARVGIVGAGAMGTSLAALVGKVVPTVMVCIEPKRAAELFEHGARVEGLVESSSRPIVVNRISDLARVGGVSALFIATKTTAIPDVARELKPVLQEASDSGEGMYVVSYQNGIEPGRQLIELLDYDRVLRMVLSCAATIPGGMKHAEMTMHIPPHAIGAVGPEHADAARRIASTLSEAGFETEFVEGIEQKVWAKGVVNAAANPVCALVDSTVRDVLDSPARMILDRLLREGMEVARADGVDLGGDFLDRAYAMLDGAADHTPSMVEDIRNGRESEVGQLNRQVLAHGRRLGVATPTHEMVDALIEAFDWRVYHRGDRQRG